VGKVKAHFAESTHDALSSQKGHSLKTPCAKVHACKKNSKAKRQKTNGDIGCWVNAISFRRGADLKRDASWLAMIASAICMSN